MTTRMNRDGVHADMAEEPREDLLVFWARLGRKPAEGRPVAEEPSVPEVATAPATEPIPPPLGDGEVVFTLSNGQWFVRIRPDGTVQFGEGYDPDLASRIFWEHLAAACPINQVHEPTADDRARELLFQTMQTTLLRIGNADIHNERAHLRARGPEATEHDRMMAQLAHDNLELRVHQVIEFARGLALRNPPG